MSKSKGRKKPQASRAQEVEARGPAFPGWRKRLGWPLCIIGVVLFVGGYVGALSGLRFLPFDQHHVFTQIGGGILAVIGLIWATTD